MPPDQQQGAQPTDDQLDVVQHPTLGTLKFPKSMPPEERNASIERLEAQSGKPSQPTNAPTPQFDAQQAEKEGTLGAFGNDVADVAKGIGAGMVKPFTEAYKGYQQGGGGLKGAAVGAARGINAAINPLGNPMDKVADIVSGYKHDVAPGGVERGSIIPPAVQIGARGVARATGIMDPNKVDEAAARGDTSGVVGHTILPAAMAVAPLAGEGIEKLAGMRSAGAASRIPTEAEADFRSAIPSTKSAHYESADFHAARQHLEQEHPGTGGVRAVRDAADTSIGKIEDHVEKAVAAFPGATINANPLHDVVQTLGQHPRGAEFVNDGMREIEAYHLDQPKTLGQADTIRRTLNAENKAVLRKNNYDVATARAADPGFAAREAAAESLRNSIYDRLDQLGVKGIRELRQQEGSIIKIRNAAQNQDENGARIVPGSNKPGTLKNIAAKTVKLGSTAAGAKVAGPAGAIVGSEIGDTAGNAITGGKGLTRDALADRSFSKKYTQAPKLPDIPRARAALTAGSSPLNYAVGQGIQPASISPGRSGTVFPRQSPTINPLTTPQLTNRILTAGHPIHLEGGEGPIQLHAPPQPDLRSAAPYPHPGTAIERTGRLLTPTTGPAELEAPPKPKIGSAIQAPKILVRDPRTGRIKVQFLSGTQQ